ncbi:hypothetical protein, partial [Vibrio aestuarianus]|uniref:hypothetical protein n=1 Tax=Vibrio aestuarianus TaxID=28171 RepID=UPI0021C352D8
YYEQWGNREYKTRVCSYSYVVADDHCISRIKKLSLALQKVSSVLKLLDILKTNDFRFEEQGSRTDEFEQEFKILI